MAFSTQEEWQQVMQQQLMQQQLMQQHLAMQQIQQRIGQVQPPAAPLERADMQVCDLIGWRIWRITASGYLQSAAAEAIWLPGEPMTGEPDDHGSKGVHAYRARSHAIVHGAGARVAVGSVLLSGEVVEHERGYRAERAKIVSIDDVTWDSEPPWSETTQKALAFLRARYLP